MIGAQRMVAQTYFGAPSAKMARRILHECACQADLRTLGRMAGELTHFDEHGHPRMVSVADKPETARQATAEGTIVMEPATLRAIEAGTVGKGDVLGTARLAAVAAAKATPQMILLCHPIRLTGVEVALEADATLVGVRARVCVHAIDRTGPEMEALVAVSAALLTVYDMCKAIDRGMRMEGVRLLEKRGGKSGTFVATAPDAMMPGES